MTHLPGKFVWFEHVSSDVPKAVEFGAQVLVAPKDIPDVGRFTVVMDPQGPVIGAIRGRFTATSEG